MSDPSRPDIDWQHIYTVLDWDAPERRARIEAERLQRRARQYAQADETEAVADSDAFTLLTFTLAGESYGIDVQAVRGVRPLPPLAYVPGSPTFYAGIVNVRGQIVSVLDLRLLFNLHLDVDSTRPDVPAVDTALLPEIVLVTAHGLHLALMVERVGDVVRVPAAAIEPLQIPYAHGMTASRLVVLDIDDLLADERLRVGRLDEGDV